MYVEPFVQARFLVVVGATPVADALARLAPQHGLPGHASRRCARTADIEAEAAALGVKVATLDALEAILGHAGPDSAVIVASQGHYDEQAIEGGLKSRVPYVGLVASRKRGTTVRALLEERGVPRLAAIRNPAGLDLGARTAQEVALSILAEIVQTLPSGTAAGGIIGARRDRRPAGRAGERGRSGLRHAGRRGHRPPHRGSRRRRLLLLLRELPRALREAAAGLSARRHRESSFAFAS